VPLYVKGDIKIILKLEEQSILILRTSCSW